MNQEKIKELAKQANMEYNVFLPDAWSGENKDLEKFAELIIQECISVINPEGDLTSMREEYGRKLSMNMIKRHFGIE